MIQISVRFQCLSNQFCSRVSDFCTRNEQVREALVIFLYFCGSVQANVSPRGVHVRATSLAQQRKEEGDQREAVHFLPSLVWGLFRKFG